MTALTGCVATTSSTAVGARLKVRGSMSASRGIAPARRMELTVAKKLKGVVTTLSPGPIWRAARASQRASVPLAQPMAWGTWRARAAAASNAATSGPRMKRWESQTAVTAARSSSRSAAEVEHGDRLEVGWGGEFRWRLGGGLGDGRGHLLHPKPAMLGARVDEGWTS
jgi:hypothetical protein